MTTDQKYISGDQH